MKSRIKTKSAFIVAVTLICIYGIIGFPRSRNELIANLQKNIRLGLDLSGGTQLVMEVELQDAFKAFDDSAIDRSKDELGGNLEQYYQKLEGRCVELGAEQRESFEQQAQSQPQPRQHERERRHAHASAGGAPGEAR